RHDQHDRQRQLPAFVLRDEYKEDEKSGSAEHEKSWRAALLLLKSEVSPLESDALRQNLVGKLLHAVQGRTGRYARRRYSLHLRGREKIVARHAIWGRIALELRHRSDGDHFTRRVAGSQAGDILRCAPEFSISLHPDLIGAAKIIEVVDVL